MGDYTEDYEKVNDLLALICEIVGDAIEKVLRWVFEDE